MSRCIDKELFFLIIVTNSERRKAMLTRTLPRRASYLFLALILSMLLGATPNMAQGSKPQKSLYERLGGYDAIAAVVDDFFKRMVADPKLGRFFIGLSTDSKMRAQQLTVDFICKSSGGPCLYTGRDMKTVHTGLGITDDDWQIATNHLVETLDKFKVPQEEKNEVLNFVSGLKGAIVEKK
jgi:hemoglobin